MTHPSLSVKGIGDESKHPKRQGGDHNTRPNKNGTNHGIKNWSLSGNQLIRYWISGHLDIRFKNIVFVS